MRRPQVLTFKFEPPNFPKHTEPSGLLKPIAEHQALFYYYVLAISNWKRENDELVLEGEKDPDANYEQLFRNCALMYNVDINTMANFWPIIDAELERYNELQPEDLRLTRLPSPLKFYNRPIIVKGH